MRPLQKSGPLLPAPSYGIVGCTRHVLGNDSPGLPVSGLTALWEIRPISVGPEIGRFFLVPEPKIRLPFSWFEPGASRIQLVLDRCEDLSYLFLFVGIGRFVGT